MMTPGEPRKFIFNGIDLTDYLTRVEIHYTDEVSESKRHLSTMALMMATVHTPHDFISACAYARELRGEE
jgi:hypothetical protein